LDSRRHRGLLQVLALGHRVHPLVLEELAHHHPRLQRGPLPVQAAAR
jgi:hypothetical protein